MDLVPQHHQEPPHAQWLWDIFCQVIDNFGDVGVCWRLAADLAARGHTVRLWLDDTQALAWMAPCALQGRWPGIAVWAWSEASNPHVLQALAPAQVWVESFGCELPSAFVAARAWGLGEASPPVWINLEYMSAEGFVERCHALPSPVMSGPAKGWTKHFFYPGFTPATGGLLREPGLLQRRDAFGRAERSAFLQSLGLADCGEALVSLFCYEGAPVHQLVEQLAAQSQPVHLLVTSGKARAQVERALSQAGAGLGRLRVSFLPLLSQTDFDKLLWSCDLNFVRGEDSLVRALWAGQPFVWQIYPQDDGAHRAKLAAFLDALDAPPPVRDWLAQWNALAPWSVDLPLPLDAEVPWRAWAGAVQHSLAQQTDLVGRLLAFVAERQSLMNN
ncbi:MAG: elongation factor P maturation arginine rhamnosyltransferase EarP [Betaproteobacteria bacterium]